MALLDQLKEEFQMTTQEKSVEELRKIFLERHYEHQAVNNPDGYVSGDVTRAWNRRIDALMDLVCAQRGKDT